jgi:hypothetical protein
MFLADVIAAASTGRTPDYWLLTNDSMTTDSLTTDSMTNDSITQ